MRRREELSVAEARRIALHAQGFGARPTGTLTAKAVRGVFDHTHVIQVDSVNVVVRSQELPLWARLGAHPRDAVGALTRRGVLFEYWAHEASLLPVELQPLFRWRMAEAREVAWAGVRNIAKKHPGYVESVRQEVLARGSLAARDIESSQPKKKRSGSWWGWDERKTALAYLFWAGDITAVRDPVRFERVYAPWDRVLPTKVLAQPTPAVADAQRELLMLAAEAMGVATAADLADYFRIRKPVARPLVAELVEAGRLREVRVEGWKEAAYLHPKAKLPAAVRGRALLSPFDSLVWERARTSRLFGFDYRIEIYVPEPKRKFGYYVLPFLLDEALVGRVDLKADRAASTLLVQSAWAEAGAPTETATQLRDELAAFASWLGLSKVKAMRRGNLRLPR